MKYIVIIVTLSTLFLTLQAVIEADDYLIPPNCTEIFSVVTSKYEPYTELYLSTNWYGLNRWKNRINYKLQNHTSYHERATCCPGYINNTVNLCLPICDNCGINEVCTKPNTCHCSRGYKMNLDLNECEPICEVECVNADCVSPKTCNCKEGYQFDVENSQFYLCKPICSNCLYHEFCVEPNVCQCAPKYKRLKMKRSEYENEPDCEPICVGDCVNATCIAPDFCSCHEGYEKIDGDELVCSPTCIHGCINGVCTDPNTCTCFPGYSLKNNSSHICEPICTKKCINSYCIAPEICSCYDGYNNEGNKSNICTPYCSDPCINGKCVNPQTCVCDSGYEKKDDEGLCLPICAETCHMGNCTSPDTCNCLKNYRLKEGNKYICHPICIDECVNGHCVAPDECLCNDGFKKQNLMDPNSKCIAICTCENGYCDESSSFCNTCKEGYNLIVINDSKICEPHCEGNCIHGQCVKPQLCNCSEDYVPSKDNEGNPICTHACGMECIHGICLSDSGMCNCSYGWAGKYCEEPFLCSITFVENELIYSQLNKSTGYDDIENMTFIQDSLPICDSRCSHQVNNGTSCINQFSEEIPKFNCFIEIDEHCSIQSSSKYNTNQADGSITVIVYSCLLILLILAIATCGVIYQRRRKLSVELRECASEEQKYEQVSFL